MVNRLNGWQRIWVVLAVVWMPFGTWQAASVGRNPEAFAVGFALAGAPLVVLYILGLTVGWIRRGFTQPAKST
jgi:hypothetical protein